VTTSKTPEPEVNLTVPNGWSCTRLGRNAVLLHCDGSVADHNTITVSVGDRQASFAMLGPNEAKDFRAGANVEYCPQCQGHKGACICAKNA